MMGHFSPRIFAKTDATIHTIRPPQRQHFAAARRALRGFGDYIIRMLLLPAEKGIQKPGVAHRLAQFAVLQKNMDRLPKGVIKNLHQFLVDERVGRWGIHDTRCRPAREDQSWRPATTYSTDSFPFDSSLHCILSA